MAKNKKNTAAPVTPTPESKAADEAVAQVNQASDAAKAAQAALDAAKAIAIEASAAAKRAREAVKEAQRAAKEASGRKSWTRKLPDGAEPALVANTSIPKLHAFTKTLVEKFIADFPGTTMDELIQQGMSRCAALANARAKKTDATPPNPGPTDPS
jgi:hypothetical protein